MSNRNRHNHPIRCIDGRIMRHDPQPDDPSLESDIGKCPECNGKGCDMEGEELHAKTEQLMRSDKTEDWAEAARLEAVSKHQETTGIADVEWLDAKVVETAKALGAAEYRRDEYKRALIAIIHKSREIEQHANLSQGEWNSGAEEGSRSCADIARNVIPEGEY